MNITGFGEQGKKQNINVNYTVLISYPTWKKQISQ